MSALIDIAIAEATAKAFDTAILILLSDKIGAERQREIRRILEKVNAGEMTNEEGIEAAKFKDGDALDKALGQ